MPSSRADVGAAASRLFARYRTTAGACHSEVRLLLSYTPEEEVAHFFDFMERVLQDYREVAELSMAEVRCFCKTPKNVRARGEEILRFLEFVASTVDRYAISAGASARE